MADTTAIAVQIVSLTSGRVAAQRITTISQECEAERELSRILLPEYQRLRTVQFSHPSVADFQDLVGCIQWDMDRREPITQ